MTNQPARDLPEGVTERNDKRTALGGVIRAKVRAGGREINKSWPYLTNPPAGQRKAGREAVIKTAAAWRAATMYAITHLGGTDAERAAREAPTAPVALSEDRLGDWFAQYIADTSLTVRLDRADAEVAARRARESMALSSAEESARDARLAAYRASREAIAREKAEEDVAAMVPALYVPPLPPIRHDSKSAQRERGNAVWLLREAPKLMRKTVAEIDTKDIEALITALRTTTTAPDGGVIRSWSDNTIRLRIAVIQSVYRRASSTWRHPDGRAWWPTNTATPVDLVKLSTPKDARPPQIITADQWTAILAECGGTGGGILAALHTLRWTGARRGEVTRLEWSDLIPPTAGGTWQARLRDTKTPTGKPNERTIPLIPRALAALLDARLAWAIRHATNAHDRAAFRRGGVGTEAKLIADLRAHRLRGSVFGCTEDAITQAWGKMRQKAAKRLEVVAVGSRERGDMDAAMIARAERTAIRDRTVHDIRHTRITEITAVMPIQKAKMISGHKTMRMLEHYYHDNPASVGVELVEAEAAAARKTAQRRAKVTTA